jgi:hypothetical protein
MWEKKRLLSEAKGRVQPFPHICPTDQRTRKAGFSPGRMGARQTLARAVTKRERAKQTNYDKKRSKLKANGGVRSHADSQVISFHILLEEN